MITKYLVNKRIDNHCYFCVILLPISSGIYKFCQGWSETSLNRKQLIKGINFGVKLPKSSFYFINSSYRDINTGFRRILKFLLLTDDLSIMLLS